MPRLDAAVRFEIFTRVPDWFFQDSLPGPCGYHAVDTDIGMVQRSALHADIDATLLRLDAFLPFEPTGITALAQQIRTLGCTLVMCDIAPMGIVVSQEAGIPSILVENFTWDWIYQAYVDAHSAMRPHVRYLHDTFAAADYRIQTEPVCAYQPADLTTPPVHRESTAAAADIRTHLGIPIDAQVVMLTMGGIPGHYPFVQQLAEQDGIYFVIPGGAQEIQRYENVVLLPHHSAFFHPDLVHAADAVVGKVGYSTVAEVYAAGIPFGYVPREDFRESPHLVAYIAQHMQGMAIAADAFDHGHWLARLSDLLSLPRIHRDGLNGADQVARFVSQLVHRVDAAAGVTLI